MTSNHFNHNLSCYSVSTGPVYLFKRQLLQTKRNPFCRMFSLHWLHVQARHCEVASDGFIYYYFEDKLCHHLKNKHSALLHHPRALHTYLILSPHQRCRAAGMISMIKSIPGDYMAMSTRHLNTKAPHPCPLPINRPPPPTILPPLSW